jgi:hypothetical protein
MIRSTLVPLVLMSGVAFAGSGETYKAEDITYDTLDQNRDGKVDRNESKAHSQVSNAHDQIDTDKNGTISRAEYEVWRRERRYEEGDKARFVQLDANKDRSVNKAEAKDQGDVDWSVADTDTNGMISEAEWMKFRKTRTAEETSRFSKLDTNRDMAIDKTEATAYADMMPDFSKADDDANGNVSEEEWVDWRREAERKEDTKKY